MGGDYSGLEGFSGAGSFEIVGGPRKKREGTPPDNHFGGGPSLKPEVAAFLARTSGLDAAHVSAYAALIGGLVDDGVWPKLDMLHIYATQDSTTALLNLVSSSFNGTIHGSPSFTADRGFTGVESSTTVYIDTGFNPATASSPKYTRNDAHLSVWNLNNTVSDAGLGSNGSNPAAQASYILCRVGDGKAYFRVNNSGVLADNAVTANATGHYIASRDTSALIHGYKTGSLVMTNTGSGSDTLPSLNLYTLGFNFNGTAKGSNNQMAMISAGSKLDATDSLNYYNRLRTYMTAVGVP